MAKPMRRITMLIERTSPITMANHIWDIDVTQQQLDNYYYMGYLVQQAFPHLSPEEREFIKTGITPEEWDDMFGDDEDDDEDEY
jgi:hypothetical protein